MQIAHQSLAMFVTPACSRMYSLKPMRSSADAFTREISARSRRMSAANVVEVAIHDHPVTARCVPVQYLDAEKDTDHDDDEVDRDREPVVRAYMLVQAAGDHSRKNQTS